MTAPYPRISRPVLQLGILVNVSEYDINIGIIYLFFPEELSPFFHRVYKSSGCAIVALNGKRGI